MNKVRIFWIVVASLLASTLLAFSRGTGVEYRGGVIASLAALLWILAGRLAPDRSKRTLFMVYVVLILPCVVLNISIFISPDADILWEGSDFMLICVSICIGYFLYMRGLKPKDLLIRALLYSSFVLYFNSCFLWPNYESWLHTLDIKPIRPLELRMLQLQGPDMKPLDMSAYAGKVVFVDIWNEGCATCLRELPEVDAIRRHFQSDTGIAVVTMYSHYRKKPGANYSKYHALFRRFNRTLPVWFDTSNQIGNYIDFYGYPLHLIFGRDGRLKEVGHYNFQPLVLYKNPRRLIRKVLKS